MDADPDYSLIAVRPPEVEQMLRWWETEAPRAVANTSMASDLSHPGWRSRAPRRMWHVPVVSLIIHEFLKIATAHNSHTGHAQAALSLSASVCLYMITGEDRPRVDIRVSGWESHEWPTSAVAGCALWSLAAIDPSLVPHDCREGLAYSVGRPTDASLDAWERANPPIICQMRAIDALLATPWARRQPNARGWIVAALHRALFAARREECWMTEPVPA